MSQYINFFISHDNGKLIPLTSFSRSNPIYKVLEYLVPAYEGVIHLTSAVYDDAYANLTNDINSFEESIKNYKEENENIIKMSDPLDVKLERIRENIEAIKDLEKEIDFYTTQRHYLSFLYDLADEWGEKNEIWIGIEVDTDNLNN